MDCPWSVVSVFQRTINIYVCMNSISMKIKSYYRKRLFMKIYFSILNHPKTEPCDALGLASAQKFRSHILRFDVCNQRVINLICNERRYCS